MQNIVLRNFLKEYEQKRFKAIDDLERRKRELYLKEPKLQSIEDNLNKYAFQITKNIISSKDPKYTQELEKKLEDLKKQKKECLQKLDIDASYLLPIYECSYCNDTGYISDNLKTKICNCLKQKLFNVEYNKSNIGNLDKENFSTFNLLLYSDKKDEKYGYDISPRENIKIIKEICEKFINNFDDPNEKNLLFTGNSGLGKTFLSNCIANELLKKGKTVLYQTAPSMLDTIIDCKFGKKSSSFDINSNILNVDFLIIDDLGAEAYNSLKIAELFNILNSRLLTGNNKNTKTLISTNLSINNLFSAYEERIVSRIRGYYKICPFFGDDIRYKKK